MRPFRLENLSFVHHQLVPGGTHHHLAVADPSSIRLQGKAWGSLSVGGVSLNCQPLVRSLLASAAVAAAIALAGCDTDGTPAVNGRHMQPLSDKLLAEIESKNMAKEFADPGADLQGRSGARSLEGGQDRAIRAAAYLSDLPLVGRIRAQDQGRRPPGAGGLLHHHPRPDESELQLLSRDQHRLPEQPTTGRTGAAADS